MNSNIITFSEEFFETFYNFIIVKYDSKASCSECFGKFSVKVYKVNSDVNKDPDPPRMAAVSK